VLVLLVLVVFVVLGRGPDDDEDEGLDEDVDPLEDEVAAFFWLSFHSALATDPSRSRASADVARYFISIFKIIFCY